MASVYFVECAGRIKIGFSNNVKARLQQLSTGAPGKLNLVATIPGPHRLERAIHRHLKAHRVKGEWFDDCAEVRAAIDDLVRNGPAAIAYVHEEPARPRREPGSAQVAITSVIKKKRPDGTKAWQLVSEVTGLSERTAKHRLANQRLWTPEEFVALLRREDGYDYLKAFMGDAKPTWWKPIPRKMKRYEWLDPTCQSSPAQ